jgi:hypothetical protein
VLRIKVNGAQTNFVAKPRPDGGWDLRCVDPLVGEFRLRPEDDLIYGRRKPENGSALPRWT